MRDIKFRAWNKKYKKMFKIGQITLKKGIWNFEPDDREYIGMSIPYQPSFILMQYTGLHDKNGKEIYEGDIVEEVYFNPKFDEQERRYGKYIVKYEEDRCGYVPFACGDGCGCCEDEVINVNNAEVIGNIYDNQDLLEKGAEDEC